MSIIINFKGQFVVNEGSSIDLEAVQEVLATIYTDRYVDWLHP